MVTLCRSRVVLEYANICFLHRKPSKDHQLQLRFETAPIAKKLIKLRFSTSACRSSRSLHKTAPLQPFPPSFLQFQTIITTIITHQSPLITHPPLFTTAHTHAPWNLSLPSSAPTRPTASPAFSIPTTLAAILPDWVACTPIRSPARRPNRKSSHSSTSSTRNLLTGATASGAPSTSM